MIVFIPYGEIIYKEYLCDYTSCLQLKFSDCFYIQVSPDYDCDTSTVNELESEDGQSNGGDENNDRNQQVFDLSKYLLMYHLSQVTLLSLFTLLRLPKKV